MNSLQQGYRALVVGASGGIGQALVTALQSDARCGAVVQLSRRTHPAFDLRQADLLPEQLPKVLESVLPQGPFDLVLDATGWLHDHDFGPEKRMSAVSIDALQQAIRINALGPFLLMQGLVPHLPKHRRVIYAKWSARVGSITDNHKGGWYSYRASKAALNQLLQTAAIDLGRSHPHCVVAAVQPGTVATPLSQPFAAATGAMSPQESAQRVLRVLDGLSPVGKAQFIDHLGQSIPW